MKKYYFSVLLFTFFACGSRNDQQENSSFASRAEMKEAVQDKAKYKAQSEVDEVLSSSAARPGVADSVHKFIRTADLKFRTSNVIRSSFAIEDVVAANNGYIQHSTIQSEVKDAQEIKCSKDSAWRVTKFVTYNRLTARVPVAKLDQTLKSLRPLVVYLDHRTVSANNISFDLLLNALKQQRIEAHSSKVDLASPKEQLTVGDQLLERQIQSDVAKVENMRTMDEVLYSTITIYMYQNEEVNMEKIPVFSDLKSYDSGLGIQFMESLYIGWQLLEFLFLLIIKSWSLLLILTATLLTIKWFRKRKHVS